MEKKALLMVVTSVATAGIIASTGSAGAAPTTAAVTATPSSGLTTGQSVAVTGSGWPASTAINLIECATPVTGVGNCDLGTLKQVTSTASGTFSASVTVHTGAVGSGSCDPGKGCEIAVATADQTVTGQATISFAAPGGGKKTSPATQPSSTAGSTTTSGGGQAAGGATASDPRTPVGVPAGNGGQADRASVPTGAVAALVLLGLGLLAATGRRVLGRRH